MTRLVREAGVGRIDFLLVKRRGGREGTHCDTTRSNFSPRR